MSIYYCHFCAAIKGWMNSASPASLVGTPYQLEKYVKHTSPSGAYPFVSIFSNPTYSAYSNYVVNTSGSGCLEVDDRGRKNLIWVAGYQVGFKIQNGKVAAPENAVKVVFHDDEWKIHAFPALSDPVDAKRCAECGRLVVY